MRDGKLDISGRKRAVAGATALVLMAGAAALVLQPLFVPPAPPLTSAVTIHLTDGMGSGVHIGNGLILSAAHVASEGDTVRVETSDGTSRDATVVWASLGYDVAVLQTSSDGLAASPLSCAPVEVGQSVTAHGSPMDFGQLTTHGMIVGVPRQVERWTAAIPVDMTILPGMSGGALLNPAGEVVGLAVGIMAYPTLAGATVTGIGFAIPSIVICGLIGRS